MDGMVQRMLVVWVFGAEYRTAWRRLCRERVLSSCLDGEDVLLLYINLWTLRSPLCFASYPNRMDIIVIPAAPGPPSCNGKDEASSP